MAGLIKVCSVRDCSRKRAVLILPDGRRKLSPQCRRHVPAAWKPYVEKSERLEAKTAHEPRQLCGAQRNGKSCRRPAGWGTDHVGFGACKLHGGSMRNHKIAAAKHEMSEKAPVMGLPLDIDPAEALLHCVRITAGEVVYATQRVHELELEDAVVQDITVTEGSNAQFGLHHEVKTTTSVSLNVWIKARQDAVDRLARYSKMAIDVGVEERRVKAAETVGQLMGAVLQHVLEDLQLTAAQKAIAPAIVHRHLTTLEEKADV